MKKIFILLASYFIMEGNAVAQKVLKVNKLNSEFQTVNIDGNIDEGFWVLDNQIENQINPRNFSCEPSAPATNNNNTASFAVVYDSSFLCVAIKVQDAIINGNDAVNLFFSMDNDRTSNCPNNWPRVYNANTFQLIINPSTSEVTSPNGQAGNVIACKSIRTTDGYSVEAKLSWAEMDLLTGLKPTGGRKIGFDVGIVDADNEDFNLNTQLIWNNCCNDRNWTEPTNFGIIELVNLNCKSPIISNKSVCNSGSVSLKPSGGVEYLWYNSNTSTTPFFTGAEYITPTLTSTTSYFIVNKVNNCISNRTKVTVRVDTQTPSIPEAITGDLNPCINANSLNYSTLLENNVDYVWKSSDATLTPNNNTVSLKWNTVGPATITVQKSTACGKSPEKSLAVNVIDKPNQSFFITGKALVCPSEALPYQVSGDNEFNYRWEISNENNTALNNIITENNNQNIKVKWNSAGAFRLSSTSNNKCGDGTTQFILVNVIPTPLTPSICKVTTDNDAAFNMVIANRPKPKNPFSIIDNVGIQQIDSLYIYRESIVADRYELIGKKSVQNGHYFVDETSIPSQQDYRYKISYRNTCGNFSPQSPLHKTIHLTMNKGTSDNIWNLIWTPYIGLNTVSTIDIYRGTSFENLTFLVSVSGNSTSYTDFDAPISNTLFYMIKIKNIQCEEMASSKDIVPNIVLFNQLLSVFNGSNSDAFEINAYPNPTEGAITISTSEAQDRIRIINTLGEISLNIDGNQLMKNEIDLSNMAQGVYMLEISSKNGLSRKSLVIK